jgi:Protein of unknown function (DUF1553)/Protein of unknown function (DUF1549)/Planctomycete cytochrome C
MIVPRKRRSRSDRFLSWTVFWGMTLGMSRVLWAAEPTPKQVEFFENRIRPLLAEHCYKCHSSESAKVKGGLRLDTRENLRKGGDSGQVLIPGNPDKSLLVQAVRYTNPDLQMPPKGERLTDAQVASIEDWVRMGAPDPRADNRASGGPGRNQSGRDHWAFQPVRTPAVPQVKMADWVQTPVDAFILEKLEAQGMKPSPAAEKRTLIRRATFDLTGLPPTPEEVRDYLEDDSAGAFEKVVDRLLKSPRYGERWGRHWLDVARYADTKGEVKKRLEDEHYPFAWTYRDYVVRSFNEDKPFNRFVIEQIAADKLPAAQKDPSLLAALGFLTVGNRYNNRRNDIINDQIDVVTKGFLGLTVTCARCHDHKFDPIPTEDYYSLHGIFNSSREPEFEPLLGPAPDTREYQEYFAKRTALAREIKAATASLRALRGKDAATRTQRRELQKKRGQLMTQAARLDMTDPGSPPRAMALVDVGRPTDSRVFLRGEAENKGEVVPRRFLEILSGPDRPLYRKGSGRLELAQAIADPANPLTARVLVNRVWQHHFGTGLVPTPDDFGAQSEPPSHPELLNYLAHEFVAGGWSIKKLHRLIMLSSVYQQRSVNNDAYARIDPRNRLLWRFNVRRLEFEALRDSILAVGGQLDVTPGGPPEDLGKGGFSTRRTLYVYLDRNNVPEVMNHFDFANPDMPTGKRYETIVPQQALFLMNSPLVIEQARHVVERADFVALTEDRERIDYLYEWLFQRPPRAEELALGRQFVEEFQPDSLSSVPENAPDRPLLRVAARRNPQARQALRKGNQTRAGRGARRSARPVVKPLSVWGEYAHALLETGEMSFVQ